MSNAEWFASFAAGVVAYLVTGALARVLSARLPPATFARWRHELVREMHRRVELASELADCDQRLWELAEKAPQPYRRAIFEHEWVARSLPPAVLAVAERIGLYRPPPAPEAAAEPASRLADEAERQVESYRWIGGVRVPQGNGARN